jgi:hypothetical protein
MSTTGQQRTPGGGDRLPIFTSVGERSSRRAGTAILVLMIAAIVAVVAVVIANSVG